MSTRYVPPTPSTPTHLLSSTPISISEADGLLTTYLTRDSETQPWSHSHDTGTTASLRKIQLSLQGIYGPAANTHLRSLFFSQNVIGNGIDTDEGGQEESRIRLRSNEGNEEESSDDGLRELADVNRADGGDNSMKIASDEGLNIPVVEEVEMKNAPLNGEAKSMNNEERKQLKKMRKKEEQRKKEEARRGMNSMDLPTLEREADFA